LKHRMRVSNSPHVVAINSSISSKGEEKLSKIFMRH
jgi:hypothetical protein